jgi:hypothetical protein
MAVDQVFVGQYRWVRGSGRDRRGWGDSSADELVVVFGKNTYEQAAYLMDALDIEIC